MASLLKGEYYHGTVAFSVWLAATFKHRVWLDRNLFHHNGMIPGKPE